MVPNNSHCIRSIKFIVARVEGGKVGVVGLVSLGKCRDKAI